MKNRVGVLVSARAHVLASKPTLLNSLQSRRRRRTKTEEEEEDAQKGWSVSPGVSHRKRSRRRMQMEKDDETDTEMAQRRSGTKETRDGLTRIDSAQ